jgi:Domain of unknown function DUF29
MASRAATLHDSDFYSWTREQAAILRRASTERLNAPEGMDWDHLADELEELAMSLENELYHRYTAVLLHLLKWRYQPALCGGGWRGTIVEQRRRIARLCRKNPGIKSQKAAEFADAYELAREKAGFETGLGVESFPPTCPFTLEQAEDPDFWPEG